jgi:hypothetical protein
MILMWKTIINLPPVTIFIGGINLPFPGKWVVYDSVLPKVMQWAAPKRRSDFWFKINRGSVGAGGLE